MNDHIMSALGGETTDESYDTPFIKPLWHFVLLPLAQIKAERGEVGSNQIGRKGPASLHSSCLGVLSANFHQIPLSTLASLPLTLVKRIFHRLEGDRGYDVSDSEVNPRPDLTTLWACKVILGLAGPKLQDSLRDEELDTAMDHTIALPQYNTLHFLAPNLSQEEMQYQNHPFNFIPKLYTHPALSALRHGGPSLELLTTLVLGNNDGSLTDANMINLKWCQHLTALWIKGNDKISDGSIRLLASSLELPGPADEDGDGETGSRAAGFGGAGRGMCRLRAWYLTGCKNITDKSMRAFAKWPGLVLLDVRKTSVTSAGIEVFNRHSQAYFSNQNADFQPCHEGLYPLFASIDRTKPSEILENLCLTLLKRPATLDERPEGERWWYGLHLMPSLNPIPQIWLPHPPAHLINPDLDATDNYDHSIGRLSSTSVYRSGGIGQIYGGAVRHVSDEASTFRTNLKTALRMQAEEEGLSTPELTPMQQYYRDKEKKGSKRKKIWTGRGEWEYEETKKEKKARLASYKSTSTPWDADPGGDKSRRFFTQSSAPAAKGAGKDKGRGKPVEIVDDWALAEGEAKMMMVRMVCDHWTSLQYTAAAASAPSQLPGAPLALQKTRKNDTTVLADILGLAATQGRHASQSGHMSSPLQSSQPLRPSQSSQSSQRDRPASSPIQSRSAMATPSSQGVPGRPRTSNPFAPKASFVPSSQQTDPGSTQLSGPAGNPFKQSVQKTTLPMGVRPLVQSQTTRMQAPVAKRNPFGPSVKLGTPTQSKAQVTLAPKTVKVFKVFPLFDQMKKKDPSKR